jgi:hypothetical protein
MAEGTGPRRLTGKVVIATHNEGKLREMRDLMAPHGLEVVSAGELGLDEPEETGTTFAENALIKAEAAAKATGLPAFVLHALGAIFTVGRVLHARHFTQEDAPRWLRGAGFGLGFLAMVLLALGVLLHGLWRLAHG